MHKMAAWIPKALGDANARLGEWDEFWQAEQIRREFADYDDNDSVVGDDETIRNLSSVSLDDVDLEGLTSERVRSMSSAGNPSFDADAVIPDVDKIPNSGVTEGSNRIPGRRWT